MKQLNWYSTIDLRQIPPRRNLPSSFSSSCCCLTTIFRDVDSSTAAAAEEGSGSGECCCSWTVGMLLVDVVAVDNLLHDDQLRQNHWTWLLGRHRNANAKLWFLWWLQVLRYCQWSKILIMSPLDIWHVCDIQDEVHLRRGKTRALISCWNHWAVWNLTITNQIQQIRTLANARKTVESWHNGGPAQTELVTKVRWKNRLQRSEKHRAWENLCSHTVSCMLKIGHGQWTQLERQRKTGFQNIVSCVVAMKLYGHWSTHRIDLSKTQLATYVDFIVFKDASHIHKLNCWLIQLKLCPFSSSLDDWKEQARQIAGTIESYLDSQIPTFSPKSLAAVKKKICQDQSSIS